MKRIVIALLLIAAPVAVFADVNAGIPAPPAGSLGDAPSAAPAPAPAPADKLHNPVDAPRDAYDDLNAAKKQGWAAAILAGLVMLTAGLSRAAAKWPKLDWFSRNHTALFVITGISTVSCAAFNALALGGKMTAVVWAALAAALAMIAPAPKAKAE